MPVVRYFVLALFVCAPTLASAQLVLDSVHVVVEESMYPSYVWSEVSFPDTLGPLPLVLVEGGGEVGPPSHGCDPLDNANEVAGNVALAERGTCAFRVKAEQAAEAGAEAIIVTNNDASNPDYIGPPELCGDCPPWDLPIPLLFVSYNSGQVILAEVASGATDVTIVPIRIAPPPPEPTVGTHDTGVVVFDVFDYGFLGADADFAGTGFVFNGENGLFVSTVLVGIDGTVVTNPYGGFSEWTAESDVQLIEEPLPSGFDTGFVTSFSNDDLGVLVTQRSYSREGDPYVIVELEVENVSGFDIDDAYIGILADWDVGDTSVDDFGGVNESLNLPYVYDADMDQYFGVAVRAYDEVLSGYSLDATTADDAQLWEALTTDVPPADGSAERVAVTGTGPYDIPPSTSVTVLFLFVAGASEAEFFINATPPLLPSTEPSAPADGFALSVYPNPTASHATVRFDLPTAQAVRVAVFDVLGRRVAVLHDGPLGAGAHRLHLDAAALPAGVYVVRATGDGLAAMQRFTVVH